MNPRSLHDNGELRDKIAAEYALGTLRGGARRRFEAWLRTDGALQAAVAQWQDRLAPLAELTPPASPSPSVWQALETRLGLRDAAPPPVRRGLWASLRDDLGFWRRLGVASTALAAILVAVLVVRQPAPGPAPVNYVATLADDKGQAVALVTGDARRGQLTVRLINPQRIGPDRSLELWAVPAQGAPRSLGLIPQEGTAVLPLPANADTRSTPTLAVTLEPKGGSPDPNGPTGPIVFKGAWLAI
jgi:anti-sigma-K factor RskA